MSRTSNKTNEMVSQIAVENLQFGIKLYNYRLVENIKHEFKNQIIKEFDKPG